MCMYTLFFYNVYWEVGIFTCEQYFDLETTWSSFMIGWDWETNGETAWMTAVNSWPGPTPEQGHKNNMRITENVLHVIFIVLL